MAYLFNQIGQLIFANTYNEDQIVEAALESGAQDMQTMDDGTYDVRTALEDFTPSKDFMQNKKLMPKWPKLHFYQTYTQALMRNG